MNHKRTKCERRADNFPFNFSLAVFFCWGCNAAPNHTGKNSLSNLQRFFEENVRLYVCLSELAGFRSGLVQCFLLVVPQRERTWSKLRKHRSLGKMLRRLIYNILWESFTSLLFQWRMNFPCSCTSALCSCMVVSWKSVMFNDGFRVALFVGCALMSLSTFGNEKIINNGNITTP